MTIVNEQRVNELGLKLAGLKAEHARERCKGDILRALDKWFSVTAARRGYPGHVEDNRQELMLYTYEVLGRYHPAGGSLMQFIEGFAGKQARGIARSTRRAEQHYVPFSSLAPVAEDESAGVLEEEESASIEELVVRAEQERETEVFFDEFYHSFVVSPVDVDIWKRYLFPKEQETTLGAIAKDHGMTEAGVSQRKRKLVSRMRDIINERGLSRADFA